MEKLSVPLLAVAILLPIGCSSPPIAKKKEAAQPVASQKTIETPAAEENTVLARWLAKRASGPTPAGYDPDKAAASGASEPAVRPRELVAAKPSGPPPAGRSIVGTYELEMPAAPAAQGDPMAAMAQGFAQMLVGSMELEISGDSKFRMFLMGITVDGRYDLKGRQIKLVADKLMGLSHEEAARLAEQTKRSPSTDRALDGFREPMVGTVAADFSRLTLHPEGRPKETMAFRRKKARTIGKATVSAAESRLLGEWRLTPDSMAAGLASAKTSEERRAAEAILGVFSLALHRDNTYSMRIMMPIEGRWKADSATITLTPTGFMGMSLREKGVKSEGLGPMVGRIASGGSQIRFADDKGSQPAMTFERAAKL